MRVTKIAKPQMDLKRALSWSSISSFEYDPEQWYQRYVMGQKTTSAAMEFGNYVDKRLQVDSSFLPQVERYPIMQHAMRATFDGIPLIGFADGWCPKTLRLKDDKTGKKVWTQERADEHGQLTMYDFLLYIIDGVKPKEIRNFISWLPTKETGAYEIVFRDTPVVPIIFETKRSMTQVLDFGTRIKTTFKAMKSYAKAHE